LADALAPELRAVYDSMAPTGPYKKNAEEVRRGRGERGDASIAPSGSCIFPSSSALDVELICTFSLFFLLFLRFAPGTPVFAYSAPNPRL